MGSPNPCEGNWVVSWVPDETQDWAIVMHKLALSYSMTALSMWYLLYFTLLYFTLLYCAVDESLRHLHYLCENSSKKNCELYSLHKTLSSLYNMEGKGFGQEIWVVYSLFGKCNGWHFKKNVIVLQLRANTKNW